MRARSCVFSAVAIAFALSSEASSNCCFSVAHLASIAATMSRTTLSFALAASSLAAASSSLAFLGATTW